MVKDRPTVIEVQLAGHGISARLDGGLLVPRLISASAQSCTVALVAGGAMLLPGDRVELQIRVGRGCSLTLLDVGGLVVHGRPGDDEAGWWRAAITVAENASLHWNALPTVIAEHARLDRVTEVALAVGATAVVRETVVFGRVGEAGGWLDARTRVTDEQGPVLVEGLVAGGGEPRPGILGGHRLMDTMLYLGQSVAMPEVPTATRLDFERAGGLLRWLGDHAHLSPLQRVFD